MMRNAPMRERDRKEEEGMKTFIIIASAIGLSLIVVVVVVALTKTSAWWSRWEEEHDNQGSL